MIQTSTCLSHSILAGTGTYCLTHIHIKNAVWYMQLPAIAFSLIITHSLIGAYFYGCDNGNKIRRQYNFTKFLRDRFVLPLIGSQLYLNYGYKEELIYSIIPLTVYLADKDEVNNSLMHGNLLACAGSSYAHDKYWGIATSLVYYGIMQVQHKNGKQDIYDMPLEDIENFIYCVFAITSLIACNRTY